MTHSSVNKYCSLKCVHSCHTISGHSLLAGRGSFYSNMKQPYSLV